MRMPMAMMSFDLLPFSSPASVRAVRRTCAARDGRKSGTGRAGTTRCTSRAASREAEFTLPHPLEGQWRGVWVRNGAPVDVIGDFTAERDILEGSLCCPDLQVCGLPLSRIGCSAPNLHFEIERESTTAVFDGEIRGDKIEGTVRDGETTGRCALERISS